MKNISEGLRAVIYFWVMIIAAVALGYGYYLMAILWPFATMLVAVAAGVIWASYLVYYLNS